MKSSDKKKSDSASARTMARSTKILKWVALTALMAYTVAMAAICPGLDAERLCSGVKVSVERAEGSPVFVTESGVLSLLGPDAARLTGRPWGSIDTRRLEERLAAANNFESVECVRMSDGVLNIRVEQMVPELRVFTDYESYYINKDGKRIEARPEFHADVPVVAGRFGRGFGPEALLPLSRAIEANPLMRSAIMMVKADGPHDIILVPRMRGHVVAIGDTSDIARKLADTELAWRKIMPRRGWEYYDTLNVRFRGLIVASRRYKGETQHGPTETDDIDPEEVALAAELGPAPEGPQKKTDNTSQNTTEKHIQ